MKSSVPMMRDLDEAILEARFDDAVHVLLLRGGEIPLEAGLALERELQQRLFESADAKDGIGAYVEKRKPSFAGK